MRKVRILTIFALTLSIFVGVSISAPAANALLTLPTSGTSILIGSPGQYAIPSGVTGVYLTANGGAGGTGGQDCGGGCHTSLGGAAGIVTGVLNFSSSDTSIGVYPGGKGGNGTTGAQNTGGGSAGSATLSGYGGGVGGNAGPSGSSGGGGGGGAATVITKNNTSTIVAVAAGAGGGGGACNNSTCYSVGGNAYAPNGSGSGATSSSGNTGGNGVPTLSTGSGGSCSASSDGGGGGGGGGGAQGGGGGGLYVVGSECGGYAGYRGSNSVSGLTSTTNTTSTNGITGDGYVQIYYLTLTPATSTKSINYGSSGSDQISVTGAPGSCSSATILPNTSGITLSGTNTCTPTINIAAGTGNISSTTSYTETITVNGSYGESSYAVVTITINASDTSCSPTTSTSGGVTIDTFTASGSNLQCGITLPATAMQYLVVGSGGGGGMRGGGGGGGGVATGIETITAGTYEIRVSPGGAGATTNCGWGGDGDFSWIADSTTSQLVTAGGGGGGGGLCAGYLNGRPGITPNGGSWHSVGGNGGGSGANYVSGPSTNYVGNGGSAGSGNGTNASGYLKTSNQGGNSYNCTYGTYSVSHPNNLYRIPGGGGGAGIGSSGSETSGASNFVGCDSNPFAGSVPNGGDGVGVSISGGSTYYGGGGGGSDGRLSTECSSYHSKGRGLGGKGGGNGLGFCEASGNSITKLAATSGNANTGGGGGGGIDGVYGDLSGSGAAGIVVIRFITAAPVISSVQCDTRTALFSSLIETTTTGVVDTFSVTTSVIPNSVLTRTYQWQSSTDGGSTWNNISGATSSSYSRTALRAANGNKYRVVVTDTDSESGLSLSTTSSVITSYVNLAIAFSSPSNFSYKYGAAGVVTQTGTTSNGTGTISISYALSTGARAGTITFDTSTTSTFKETITSSAFFPGTYVETITATDSTTASTSETLTVTVSVGDTVTVTAGSPSAITYSPTMTIPTNSFSTSGLVGGDTVTVSYAYSFVGTTCATGGTCHVGDTGPAGGYIFYVDEANVLDVATGISSGGHYLEAAPPTYSSPVVNWCEGISNPYTSTLGTSATAIGTGASNTLIMVSAGCNGGAGYVAANATISGYSDWFLPSYNELAQMYSNQSGIGINGSNLYWGSTETSNWIAASLVPWAGIGSQNKGQATPLWPIRAFSGGTVTNLSGSPTNAGTFTITPTATFTTGSSSNYVAIKYVTGSLTINKATQALLRVNNISTVSFDQIKNTAFSLSAVGGSDTGTATFAFTSGPNTTCSMPTSSTLISATTGTCLVSVTKAATINYLSATSDTATVSFIEFFAPSSPTAAPGSGKISLPYTPPNPTIDPDQTPVFTWSSYSARANSTLTISGSGFTGINEVDFDSGEVVMITPVNDTTITLTVPNTAQSGPLILVKTRSNGSQLFARTNFTLLP
jgi:hypothetical protein